MRETMKTAVIVTNQHHGPTPIIYVSMNGGKVFIPGDGTTFIIDFDELQICGVGGGRTPMTKAEAAAWNADFGLWFVS